MARHLVLALAFAGLALSCGPTVPTVTVRGKALEVSVIAQEKDRRSAVLSPRRLLVWPRERFLKLEPGNLLDSSYDVAFLGRSGTVVDTGRLDRENVEGLVPQAEAAAVLLLAAGDLAKMGVQKGDAAGLSNLPPAEDLPLLKIGGIEARVELALTASERNHGLMFRPRMSADDGMLFAYPEEHSGISFWMKNTLIPLDIAFFKEDGTLVNVRETPTAEDPRGGNPPTALAAGPARFVLEMNRGWFRKKGLLDAQGNPKPGVKAEFPPEVFRGRFD